MGARITVPTFDGPMHMTLPLGAQGGQRFRPRDKGLPREKGKTGDLFAAVQVAILKTPTSEEHELFPQLAARSSFNPREDVPDGI
jgi:DnaJ-class molecular chaperone